MTTTPLTHTPQDSGVPASARDFSVEERVVIVTGAAQGIGRELARQFAAAGAFAVVADLDIAKAEAVVKEIEEAGGAGLAVGVDVADESSVTAMVDTVIDTWGRVDVLINNASIFATIEKGPFDEIPLAQWEHVLRGQRHRQLPVRQGGGRSYAHGGLRPHHQHLIRRGDPGHRQLPALRHLEVGDDRHDQLPGARTGRPRNHRQLRAARQRRHRGRTHRQPHRRSP